MATTGSQRNDKCELCDATEVTMYYCDVCQVCVCSRCAESHRRLPLTKSHVLTLRKEKEVHLSSEPVPSYCPTHPHDELTIYCDTCADILCTQCQKSSHKKHSCTPVTEEREKLQKLCMDCVNKLFETTSALKSDNREATITKDERIVELQNLKAELQERKNKLQGCVETTYKNSVAVIDEEITQITSDWDQTMIQRQDSVSKAEQLDTKLVSVRRHDDIDFLLDALRDFKHIYPDIQRVADVKVSNIISDKSKIVLANTSEAETSLFSVEKVLTATKTPRRSTLQACAFSKDKSDDMILGLRGYTRDRSIHPLHTGPCKPTNVRPKYEHGVDDKSTHIHIAMCTSFGRAEYMRIFDDKAPSVKLHDTSGLYCLKYPNKANDEALIHQLLSQLVEYEVSLAFSHLQCHEIEQIVGDLHQQYLSNSILICKNEKTGVVHIVGPKQYPIAEITKAVCDVLKVIKGSRIVLPDASKVDPHIGQHRYDVPRIPTTTDLMKSKNIDTHLYVERKTHFQVGNIFVYLDKVNITDIPVDCIVNPANDRMKHVSGVARNISDAAGPDFKNYCNKWIEQYGKIPKGKVVVTPVFQLTNCQHCIHVVGPKWGDYKDKQQCADDLAKCVKECLKMAETLKHESIAIPPISAGVFRVPKEVVFDSIYYGISEHYTNTDCNVRHVHIVDNNKDTIEFFVSCLQQLRRMETKHHQHNQNVRSSDDTPNQCRQQRSHTRCSISGSEVEPVETDVFANMTGSKGRTRRPSDSLGASHNVPVFTRRRSGTGKGATASKVTGESDNRDDDETCVICMDEFDAKTKKLKCGHKFCKECIDLVFKSKPDCPICVKLYEKLTGNQPPGQMITTTQKEDIPGYRGCGHIKIVYSFNNGTQMEEHPNPGVRYIGISRTAYLPNNSEGQKILRLLEAAFEAKLTFTIGRSMITGRDNQITWNITHKTNIHGGPQAFGYPDPDYLQRVQDELADKGITELNTKHA